MAENDDGQAFVGLAELLCSLIRETGEAVYQTRLAQNDCEGELRAVASLDVEAAADRLVAAEAVEALLARLLSESGADLSWPNNSAAFLALVKRRFAVALTSPRDYSKRGLTAAGRAALLAAARQCLAAEQLATVRKLVNQGSPRVNIGSGMISVKLEMRASKSTAGPAAKDGSREAVPKSHPTSKPLDVVKRHSQPASEIRIVVRPAQREDAAAAGIIGELRVNFTVV